MKTDERLYEYNFKEEKSWNGTFSIDSAVERQHTKMNNIKGIAVMIISSLLLGIMGFWIKVTYERFPEFGAFDVLFVRSVLMIIVYYPYAKYLGVNLLDVDFHYAKLIFLRACCGVCGMTLLFMSIHYLPASISFMIFNVNPLIVFILAYIFLKEDISLGRLLWVVMAFSGILLVGFGRQGEKTESNSQVMGVIIAFLAAFGSGTAFVTMRKINKSIHFIYCPYYVAVWSTLVAIFAYFYDNSLVNFSRYGSEELMYLCLWGIFSLSGQLLLSVAYKYADASIISPLYYTNCIFNLFTDIFYFRTKIFMTDILGGIIILLWVSLPVLLLIQERKRARTRSEGYLKPLHD